MSGVDPIPEGFNTITPHLVIDGAAEAIEFYKKALKQDGGRMFVVVGEAPVMKALLVTRIGKNEWTLDELFETCIDPLINAEKPAEFVF